MERDLSSKALARGSVPLIMPFLDLVFKFLKTKIVSRGGGGWCLDQKEWRREPLPLRPLSVEKQFSNLEPPQPRLTLDSGITKSQFVSS